MKILEDDDGLDICAQRVEGTGFFGHILKVDKNNGISIWSKVVGKETGGR